MRDRDCSPGVAVDAVFRGVLPGVLVGLLLGATACRPTDACAAPGTACGGDPVGQWTMDDSCQDPALLDMAIAKRTYRGQPSITAEQPPPEPTSTDWCADLVYGPNGINFLNLPRDTPRLLGAYLNYAPFSPDDHGRGSYGALVTSSDTTSIEFSASCLTRFGFSASCTQFGEAFAAFGTGLGGVKETVCTDAAGGGCLCTYLIESDAAGSNLSGKWSAGGHVLTHFAGNMVLPSQVDYCVQGDHMTIWGHNRTNILDMAGVRTLTLHRIVCGDGMVERGEQCDPPDPALLCNSMCQRIAAP